MKYNLTKPCKDCPFLKSRNFPLGKARKREIATSLLTGATFPCHKTTKFDNETEDMIAVDSSEHCAGAMIALEKIERPNQMMRIAERLGMYDHRKLDMTVKTISLGRWASGR